MASFSLKLLFLVSALLLLGVASAQEFYDDEPTLEQYSPLLGENFIDYPMLEEYGVPTVEEFPDEDPDEDDENDENEENDSTETEHKDKKDNIKHRDNEHAQKPSSALNSKSDAREKRQLPLQEDPVEIAREKLQRAIKAAQALSGIEKELGLNPATIENKTAKLETELKSEETNFKKLADETQDQQKKAKLVKLEKDADDDVNKAENILKLIVKLEAAKYLANERAKQDLEKAQKRKMASMPPAILSQPLSYPSQAAGYFGGIQQPVYQPPMQSYTASYQPQMFQGLSPSMAPAPSNALLPASITGPTNVAPPYQPAYRDNAEIQSINAIKETQATASVLPVHSSSQQTAESVEPESTKIASFSSEAGNTDVNTKDMEFNDLPSPSPPNKPTVVQQPKTILKTQPNTHELTNNDLKAPQMHAKSHQTNKETASAASPPSASQPAQPVAPAQSVAPAQPVLPAQPVASAQPVLPAQPVAPAQPVLSAQPVASVQPVAAPAQTFESVIGQSNGLMSQTAPLTASYNPSITTPNLAPISRYFDSSSNSPNLLASQSFYQPMPQIPPQAIAPPAQPKKPNVKGSAPAKPAVSALTSAYNDQPQIVSSPNSANVQPPSPAAYSSDQALSGAYPSNSFYSWNTQALHHSSPQFSWNSPMYYPAPAPYQVPANPLIAAAYRKLHDTERANLAMSKIEEAIGLSPNSVRHVIDDIEKQAKQEEVQYEDDMSKEKAEINKEKELIQNDEAPDAEEAKEKIKEDEAKLRNNIQKENVAKLEVDKIKKIEKILTIIEAAKYSAMQRAKKRISKLKGADDGTDSDDIRKRDLEDLERDIRRRRRNEINIWLKGSRNRIDTSHFIRNHFAKLRKQREKSSRWGSDDKKLSDHSQNENLVESAVNDIPAKESTLHKLRFYKTLVSKKKLDSGKQFAVEKRNEIPEKREKSANAFVMAKMLEKMDKLFKIQEDILKYLKAEHDVHGLQKKPAAQRWRRSLHHSKHHAHKTIHKEVKRKKRKAN